MDLRLSVSREDGATVVHVDGRLAVHGVRDLESTVSGAAGPVVLDLSNLLSADDAGVAALRLMVERGVQLRETSPYVSLLLRADPPRHRGT
jgi:anti-anti-sigma regulatory factor